VFITPDGVNLYTEEDVQALRTERDTTAQQQYEAGSAYATRSTSNRLRANAIDWFKNEVAEGTMSKEDAEGIFNGLANAIGWEEATISTLWTVTVEFMGNTIAEFNDIEADDADEAESEVSSNLSVDDVKVTIRVSYGSEERKETVNTTYHFDQDDLEFNAVVQD
jgi:hypothetical protein